MGTVQNKITAVPVLGILALKSTSVSVLGTFFGTFFQKFRDIGTVRYFSKYIVITFKLTGIVFERHKSSGVAIGTLCFEKKIFCVSTKQKLQSLK